jgi:hypothetical protein
MAPHSPDARRRLAGSDDWSLIDEQPGAIARIDRMTGGSQDGQWFWAALTVFSDTPTRLDNMESSQNLGRRNLAYGASAARRLGKAEHPCPMVQRSAALPPRSFFSRNSAAIPSKELVAGGRERRLIW